MAKATTARKTTTTTAKSATKTAPKATTAAKRTTTTARTTKLATPKTTGVTAPVAVEAKVALPELKKKDLIEQAVQRSGVKKAFAKSAIEAALAIMGETLDRGEGLNLEPLGKVKIQREKEVQGGKVITTRVRRKTTS